MSSGSPGCSEGRSARLRARVHAPGRLFWRSFAGPAGAPWSWPRVEERPAGTSALQAGGEEGAAAACTRSERPTCSRYQHELERRPTCGTEFRVKICSRPSPASTGWWPQEVSSKDGLNTGSFSVTYRDAASGRAIQAPATQRQTKGMQRAVKGLLSSRGWAWIAHLRREQRRSSTARLERAANESGCSDLSFSSRTYNYVWK